MAKHYNRNNSGEQDNRATYGDLDSHQTRQMYDSYTTLRECGVSHRAAKRILSEEHNVRRGTVDSVKRYEGRCMAEQRANLTDSVVAEARQRYQNGEAINDLVRAYQIMKSDFYSHIIGENSGLSDIADFGAYRASRRQVQETPLEMAANGEDMSAAYRRGASSKPTGRSNIRIFNEVGTGEGKDGGAEKTPGSEKGVQDHLYGAVPQPSPAGSLGETAVPSSGADGSHDLTGGLPPLVPEAPAEDAPTDDELAEAERLLDQAGTHKGGEDPGHQQPPDFVPVRPKVPVVDDGYDGRHGGPNPSGHEYRPSYDELTGDVRELSHKVDKLTKDYSKLEKRFTGPWARIKRVAAGVAIGLAGMYAGYFGAHHYEAEPAQQTIASLESSTDNLSKNVRGLSDRVGEYQQQAEADATTIATLERENKILCDQQSIDDAVAGLLSPKVASAAGPAAAGKPADAKPAGYVPPKTEGTPAVAKLPGYVPPKTEVKSDAKPAGYVAPAAAKEASKLVPAAETKAHPKNYDQGTMDFQNQNADAYKRLAKIYYGRDMVPDGLNGPVTRAIKNAGDMNHYHGKFDDLTNEEWGSYLRHNRSPAKSSSKNTAASAAPAVAAAASSLESKIAPEDESQLLAPLGDVSTLQETKPVAKENVFRNIWDEYQKKKAAKAQAGTVPTYEASNVKIELSAKQKEVVYDNLGNVIERNPLFLAIENAVSRNRVVNYTSDIRMEQVPGQLNQIAGYVTNLPTDFTLERALGFYSQELAFAGEDRTALVAGIASLVNSGELDNGIFLRATYAMAAGETTPIKVTDGEYLGSNSALDKLAKPKKGPAKLVHNISENVAGKARGLNPFWGAHVKHHAKHAAQ